MCRKTITIVLLVLAESPLTVPQWDYMSIYVQLRLISYSLDIMYITFI